MKHHSWPRTRNQITVRESSEILALLKSIANPEARKYGKEDLTIISETFFHARFYKSLPHEEIYSSIYITPITKDTWLSRTSLHNIYLAFTQIYFFLFYDASMAKQKVRLWRNWSHHISATQKLLSIHFLFQITIRKDIRRSQSFYFSWCPWDFASG